MDTESITGKSSDWLRRIENMHDCEVPFHCT